MPLPSEDENGDTTMTPEPEEFAQGYPSERRMAWPILLKLKAHHTMEVNMERQLPVTGLDRGSLWVI